MGLDVAYPWLIFTVEERWTLTTAATSRLGGRGSIISPGASSLAERRARAFRTPPRRFWPSGGPARVRPVAFSNRKLKAHCRNCNFDLRYLFLIGGIPVG